MYRRKVAKLSNNANKPYKVPLGIDNESINTDSNRSRSSCKPLEEIKNSSVIESRVTTGRHLRFNALFRKSTLKKNKTWDGDGVIICDEDFLLLRDNLSKKIIGRSRRSIPEEGEELKIGQYEVLVEAVHELVERNEESSRQKSCPSSEIKRIKVTDGIISSRPSPASKNCLAKNPLQRNQKLKLHQSRRIPVVSEVTVNTSDTIHIDSFVNDRLKPHQKEAVKFLYRCVMGMKSYGGRGALLADAMGLGKTFTIIALVWTLLNQQSVMSPSRVSMEKVLIVCPVTLINNWVREFHKWLGRDKVGICVAESAKNLKEFASTRRSGKYLNQIMLIGYEKLRTVSEELRECQFDLVVCDEGHRLKTPTNKSAQAILNIDTDRRIILSGTPIQNDLGEFFTMIDFLNPGILGTYNSFKRQFEAPIVKARQPGASSAEIEAGEEKSAELSALTRKFILRRSEKVLEKYLPPKTETIVFCGATQSQKEAFEKLQEQGYIQRWLTSSDSCSHLRNILHLRKICNSSLLAKDAVNFNQYGSVEQYSGKTLIVEAMLEFWYSHTTEKVILVSNFTKTLDLLECVVAKRNYKFLRLDGDTPASKRQSIVNKFNNGDREQSFVFLLSTKSGGVGLNLIGASRLILYDTDWNPSVDRQAMARIHREGQKRPVYIYRLLLTGTIDEKVFQRQITKQGLADQFMEGVSDQGDRVNSFTYGELKDLFTYHKNTISNTHDLLGCRCFEPLFESRKDIQISFENSSGSDSQNDWISATQALTNQQKQHDTKESIKQLFEFDHFSPQKLEQLEDEALVKGFQKGFVTSAFVRKFG